MQQNIILKLYKKFDSHRNSRIWVFYELIARSYEDIKQKYKEHTSERSHFPDIHGF